MFTDIRSWFTWYQIGRVIFAGMVLGVLPDRSASSQDLRYIDPAPTTAIQPQGPAASSFVNRTEVFDNAYVKGSEFLRKMKAIARRKKLTCRWVPERGSGSHGTL
jgi:hypothetical protein